MIAEQSGHVVPIDQPEVVVDAIRTVVETARGHDVPLCATPLRTLTATALGNESALRQETDRSARRRSTRPVAALGSGAAGS